MNTHHTLRRSFIKKSALGFLGISLFGPSFANDKKQNKPTTEKLFYRYPCIHDKMVSEVVGAAHTNFARVKELVLERPELVFASWDWGFGDFETALGAASHVGRRDIAEFLIDKGARPDIFTYAMLGAYDLVKNTIETFPGIQSHLGPHGITLLQHAKNRLRNPEITPTETTNVNKVIEYLEALGNADIKPVSIEISEEEKNLYLGEYRFGEADDEVFVLNLNMRKLLQISRKGNFGKVLNKIANHSFSPSGAASVKINFTLINGKAQSLTIYEGISTITAKRIL